MTSRARMPLIRLTKLPLGDSVLVSGMSVTGQFRDSETIGMVIASEQITCQMLDCGFQREL